MKTYILLLQDGTVGQIHAVCVRIGDSVTVYLHNENGKIIKKTGIVAEILETEDY